MFPSISSRWSRTATHIRPLVLQARAISDGAQCRSLASHLRDTHGLHRKHVIARLRPMSMQSSVGRICISRHDCRYFSSPAKESSEFQAFQDADANKDGLSSFEEFQAMRAKPTMKQALEMPRHFYEMSNDVLLLMAARGVSGAQRERLAREIMAVDMIEWDAAQPKVKEIESAANEGIILYEMPFFVGASAITVVGLLSIPMVFSLGTAEWFFDLYVTGDHPPSKELETTLEVGGWTWNWMEPLIGTCSFLILAAQLTRGLLINVRIYFPWATRITSWQVKQVQVKYPRYNPIVLEDFVGGLRGQL